MSEVKVNKISPRSGTDVQLGDSGDTITVPTGATFDASNATTTLPSTIVTTTGSQTLTNKTIDASQLTGTITPSDNTVTLAKLTATGTKDATTFLRGDNTFSTISAGITEADMWRLTTFATLGSVITANLERVDTNGYSSIGTGMTESSGIFSFPSTGIWLINTSMTGYNGSSTSQDVSIAIEVTLDNSSYAAAANGYSSIGQSTYYFGTFTSHIFDVTNTSTHKVRFNTSTQHVSSQAFGSSSANNTWFQFIRLGDT